MPITNRMVQVVHLPDEHQVLTVLRREFHSWGVAGRLVSSADHLSPYRLEFSVPIENLEGDAMLRTLETDRAESEIWEGEEVVEVEGV